DRGRLEVVATDEVVGERAGETNRSIPESRMADESRHLLRGGQRPELAHRALDVEAAPGERVEAGVPKELVGIFCGVRAGVPVRDSGFSPPLPPIALENPSRAGEDAGLCSRTLTRRRQSQADPPG